MDRRAFLSTSLMTAAALKALPLDAAAAPAAVPAPLPTLGAARFQALIGQAFQVAEGRRALGAMRLTAVEAGPEAHQLEQFSVRFESDHAPAPGLYALHHPATGPVALRLESAGAANERVAVFSLLLTPEGNHV